MAAGRSSRLTFFRSSMIVGRFTFCPPGGRCDLASRERCRRNRSGTRARGSAIRPESTTRSRGGSESEPPRDRGAASSTPASTPAPRPPPACRGAPRSRCRRTIWSRLLLLLVVDVLRRLDPAHLQVVLGPLDLLTRHPRPLAV